MHRVPFLFLLFALCGGLLRSEPLVILVSIDGCRWDYPELHEAPFLKSLSREGARLTRLTPSYPTKTFPNHYTLVTGLRPESHGIIQNSFYDSEFDAWFGIGKHPSAREGRWWGGEPIWLTAQRQGLRTACMFWPGTAADILGARPDKWFPFDSDLPNEERVRRVLEWTALSAAERPHFITLYFEAVDSAGHSFGPDAPQTRAALQGIDRALAGLRAGLKRQRVWESTHLIVTADHGMTYSDPAWSIVLDDLIDLADVQVIFAGSIGGLHVKRGDADALVATLDAHPRLRAFRRDAVPERLHFSRSPRIPDIVLIPDLGWHIDTRSWLESNRNVDYGDHGYDPSEADMGALFIARGPRIKPRLAPLPAVDNIHVYQLLCDLLEIEPAPNEGDNRLALMMLSRPPGSPETGQTLLSAVKR